MSANYRQPRRQEGLALVETAICLPILLFLMLASAEVTNVFVQHNTLTKAVRDGARFAAGVSFNHGGKVFDLRPDIISDTKSIVVFGDTSGAGTAVLPNFTVGAVTVTGVAIETVEVRATYAYTGIIGSVLPAFGFGTDHSLGFNLEASVRMRAL
ncbi:MAG: TadE/TadG family type IV pilus assembly protein [Woeseiaceae bacterium]